MSDILIKGMEMPKTCSQCPLCYDYMMCSLRDGRFSHMGEPFDCCEMRLADCPLVELPEQTVETNLFDKEEIHDNCTVQVLTNSVTGEVSVGWWENDNKPIETKEGN